MILNLWLLLLTELFNIFEVFLQINLRMSNNFEVFANHIYFQPKYKPHQEDERHILLLNQVQYIF